MDLDSNPNCSLDLDLTSAAAVVGMTIFVAGLKMEASPEVDDYYNPIYYYFRPSRHPIYQVF